MEKIFKENLLNQPIADLDLSQEFKVVAKKYHYNTLGDILRLEHLSLILKHKEFSHRLFFEFTNIICKNKLGNYINEWGH